MKLQLSSLDAPAHRRLDYWRDIVRELVGVELDITEDDRAVFDAGLKVWNVGGITFQEVSTTYRGVVRQIDAMSDDFCVNLQCEGRDLYENSSATMEMPPGQVGMVDLERPFNVHFDADRLLCVRLPRRMLLERIPSLDKLHLQEIRGPSAQLVTGYLRTLASLTELDPATAPAVMDNLAGLIAIAAGTSPALRDGIEAGGGIKHARLQAVLAHLDDNYADGGLDPTAVAATFGISVRYLHKLFELNGGTFAEELTHRRLRAARAMLADRAQAGRTVTDIAFGAGFNDLSHFGRRFKTLFGVTPREYRAEMAALR